MTTLITIINPLVILDNEWIKCLNACKIGENVYITSFSLVNAKSILYGAGYNRNEVLISKLEAICLESLKSNNQI